MSEIEKMYENSGIEKDRHCTKEGFCYFSECSKCDYYNYAYPPFTTEKQLELIKWLCQKTYRNYLLIKFNFTNYFWQIECNMTDSDRVNNFSEALASVCNNLWQDLTEEEKQQVKGILE